MKFLLTLTAFLTIISITHAQNNTIEILGSTNVNKFKCDNNISDNKNEIFIFNSKDLPELKINVDSFDCHNRIMTNDLKKTLAVKQYPNMYINFLSFTKIAANKYNANVQVTIMNKTQKYQIQFSHNSGKLTGKKNVNFSDFSIKPPSRLGGAITVKDQLNLNFSINTKL